MTTAPTQLTLADAPAQRPVADVRLPSYQRHSATSREAALSVYGRTAEARAAIVAWLDAHGPSTDEAIAAGLGWDGNTERPRRVELVRLGLVEAAGEGMTAKGRKAVRWGLAGGGGQ